MLLQTAIASLRQILEHFERTEHFQGAKRRQHAGRKLNTYQERIVKDAAKARAIVDSPEAKTT